MTPRQHEIAVEIGRLIAEGRKARGLTQAALASRLKILHPTLKSYEQGRRMPGIKLRLKLAKLFGLTCQELWIEDFCPRCGGKWK